MRFKMGRREIGDGESAFITFEAGPTHSGVTTAKRLVDLAADAGADAVKFQICDPGRLIADRSQPFSYDVLIDDKTGKTETITEPLYDILMRRVLTKDEWRQVKKHADGRGLAFFATVEFEEHVDLLEELGCDSIKIASHDVNFLSLLKRAAKTGMSIQLDTGRATLGEIESAVDFIREQGNPKIIVHHCPSGYPARIESIHLRMIPMLKQALDVPIAYSDHTPGRDMDIAAIALGANLVEKTITEDRMTRSVEHMFSLDPSQMKEFVGAVRDLEKALGTVRRVMQPAEREKRIMLRRSAFLARPMKAGEVVKENDLEFRMPGNGIPPDAVAAIAGRKLRRERPAGHRLDWSDLD